MSAVNTVLLALLLADAPKETTASPVVIRMAIVNTSAVIQTCFRVIVTLLEENGSI